MTYQSELKIDKQQEEKFALHEQRCLNVSSNKVNQSLPVQTLDLVIINYVDIS